MRKLDPLPSTHPTLDAIAESLDGLTAMLRATSQVVLKRVASANSIQPRSSTPGTLAAIAGQIDAAIFVTRGLMVDVVEAASPSGKATGGKGSGRILKACLQRPAHGIVANLKK